MLSSFTGDPNGTWEMYIVDDAGTDVGSISGWELTLYPFTDLCSIVPLTLLSFNAVEETGTSATLQWKTSGEYNTHSFEVEESSGGISFKTIANVPAVGLGENTYLKKLTFLLLLITIG